MSVVSIDKWVSGEVETFFAPQQVPPAPVFVDCKHHEETSTAPSEVQADQPQIIPASRGYDSLVVGASFALIAAIAAAGLVSLVVWTQPIAPPTSSPAAAEKLAAAARPLTNKPIQDQLPSAEPDRLHRDMARWFDHTTNITPAPDTRRPPPRQASQRHYWSPVRAKTDRGQAARLMQAELRQMGITPKRRHQRTLRIP
jgi:hypothetical protein